MTYNCDAVFEGGGVKGIGLVGAVSELEKAGYKFINMAGTSAGAIVASLLAAGYNADEIKKELMSLDFERFREDCFLGKLGFAGRTLNILIKYGIYCNDYFEYWLTMLLARKNKFTFSDLITQERPGEKYKYKFQAIASDISDKKMLVLPQDLAQFGIDPDSFPIAKAVRMSMSIPIYYEPYKLKDSCGNIHFIVDGGVLSNYPIWLLDDPSRKPSWPTIGMKFANGDLRPFCETEKIHGISDYIKAIMSTAMEAHDNYYVSTTKGDKERTIFISASVKDGNTEKQISSTDFGISREECIRLFDNGAKAAQKFLKRFDFEDWKRKFRF